MSVNWNMGAMPDIGGNALAAFKNGQQERRQEDGQKALSAYAVSPDDPNAFGALAQFHPQIAIQERERITKKKEADAERQTIGAALNGDQEARKRLAYVNSEMFLKLGDEGKKQLADTYEKVGQGAWSILQMPPEQQGPALQQFMQQMQIDPSKLNLNGTPEQNLKMALAYAGKLDEWEKFAQPDYTAVGEAGLAGFQFGKPIMQGGAPQNFGPALPEGFVLDDGGPESQAPATF